MDGSTDFLPSPACTFGTAVALAAWGAGLEAPQCLADVWTGLMTGALHVVATHDHDERLSVLVAAKGSGAARGGLSPRDRDVLEHWLRSGSQKFVALEFGISVSSVSTSLKRSLALLGVHCAPNRVPAVLVMVAHAGVERNGAELIEVANSVGGFSAGWVAAVSLFLASLPPMSPAERDVVRRLLKGETYLEIAAARSTSVRTVANQVARIFRKQGVSGRLDLVIAIVKRAARSACAVA